MTLMPLRLPSATRSGVPSVRMVLIKGADNRGLRFFSNAESQKGRELEANPQAALCFHWKSLRKQVRFEGRVSPLDCSEVDAYFHSRSRDSQIAAAVSKQSHVLASHKELFDEARAYAASLGDAPVPLPETWTGYLLRPNVVEFWQDGPRPPSRPPPVQPARRGLVVRPPVSLSTGDAFLERRITLQSRLKGRLQYAASEPASREADISSYTNAIATEHTLASAIA